MKTAKYNQIILLTRGVCRTALTEIRWTKWMDLSSRRTVAAASAALPAVTRNGL